MRPGGGRKSSQKAGQRGYGRNRGSSSAGGGADEGMYQYRQNGKLTLDDISTCRLRTFKMWYFEHRRHFHHYRYHHLLSPHPCLLFSAHVWMVRLTQLELPTCMM